jgi:hypothetical protein
VASGQHVSEASHKIGVPCRAVEGLLDVLRAVERGSSMFEELASLPALDACVDHGLLRVRGIRRPCYRLTRSGRAFLRAGSRATQAA